MTKLEVKLLGFPMVKLNRKLLEFPYKKVEALFYYMVVKKKVSRDRIASLLWGDMIDGAARKNLRNALYQLKQKIGPTLINTPDRSTIELDKGIEIKSDLDAFLNEEGPNAVEAYKGEFLQGFEVKKAPEFSNWMYEQRNYYRELYIRKLNQYIDRLKKQKDWKQTIFYLNLLIQVDEFNETAYRDLMRIHAEQGDTSKAIKIYKQLKHRLNKELGIAPDPATLDLYRKIKRSVSFKKTPAGDFIGRHKELSYLTKMLQRFIRDEKAASVIVTGEAGIGKTTLVEKAISSVKLGDSGFKNQLLFC